jgi:hypothetical protein
MAILPCNRAAHQSGTSFSPQRVPQLAAGDDQHSKIWREGGARFGGYRFGRSERHFLVLGPRRRVGRLPPLAVLQAISPLITVIFGTALIGLLAAWITARAAASGASARGDLAELNRHEPLQSRPLVPAFSY